MGETPKTALPPQDRAASPRPRCIAGDCYISYQALALAIGSRLTADR
ncbi:MAG: hypothetical protein F6K65_07200 [Moorea sp. SIO3C2]|nr:hypothetical protein [Moorena sp. SIO3C2]